MSSELHPDDRVRQTLTDPARPERLAHWRGANSPESHVRFSLRELLLAVTSTGVILGLGCRSEEGVFLAVQAIGLASVGILCLRAENRHLLGPFDMALVSTAATIAGLQIANGYIFGYWGASGPALILGTVLMLVSTVLFFVGLVTFLPWIFSVPAWRPGVLFRGWSRLAATTAFIPISFHFAMVVGMIDRAGLFYADAFVDDCVTVWNTHHSDDSMIHYVRQVDIPPAIKRVGPKLVSVRGETMTIARSHGAYRYGYEFSADRSSGTCELRWYAEDLGVGTIQKGRLP